MILFMPIYRGRYRASRAEAKAMDEAIAAYNKRLPEIVENIRKTREVMATLRPRDE